MLGGGGISILYQKRKFQNAKDSVKLGATIEEASILWGFSPSELKQLLYQEQIKLTPPSVSRIVNADSITNKETTGQQQLKLDLLSTSINSNLLQHLSVREIQKTSNNPLDEHPKASKSEEGAWSPKISQDTIRQMFACLAGREGKILGLRMGLTDGYGWSLEEIGQLFNITRERVRQIERKSLFKLGRIMTKELIQELYGLDMDIYELINTISSENTHWVSMRAAMKLLGCNRETLLELVESGRIATVREHNGRLLYSKDGLQNINVPRNTCRICGKPVPQGRHAYCSKGCYQLRWQYQYWPEERKIKHREAIENWKMRHPEELKVIQARASHKYQRKLKRIRHLTNIASNISKSRPY